MAAGKRLVDRLAIYPSYARTSQIWVDPWLAHGAAAADRC